MTTTSPETRPGSNVRRALLWATVFTLGVFLVGLLVAFVVYWPQDTNPDGQCSGIGWGCSLTPRDSVLFAGLLGTPFALLGAALACGLVGLARLVPALRRWGGLALGGLAAFVLWLVVGLLVVANLYG